MTKGIENTLGLRSLDEALAAFGAAPSPGSTSTELVPGDDDDFDVDDLGIPADIDQRVALAMDRERRDALEEDLLSGADTERNLDDIHQRLLRHAETMADLAMELDPGRAPRAFEVANALIKNAMDAVTSKRDHQLKTMKALQDQKRLELEERKLAGKSDAAGPGEGGTVIQGEATVISTNTADLLRNLQNQMKEMQKEPPPQGDISGGTASKPK